MYTPIGILIAEALASITVATSGGFLFWSVNKLIKTKKMKSEVLKPADFESFKRRKLLPPIYFEVFCDTVIFLLMVHIYCGLIR